MLFGFLSRIIIWLMLILMIIFLLRQLSRQAATHPKPKYIGLPQINTIFDPKESKGERKCRDVFEEFYGRPFPKVEHMFRNPETGRFLELDGHNAELRLAFEYQGSHHYNDRKQARRDHIKREWCNAENIYLIPIPHKVTFRNIYGFIAKLLPPVLDQYLADDATRTYVRGLRNTT